MQFPKLVESKTANSQVTTIEWNPGMDLLAIVFNNESITCSRLLSLQKVWHKQATGKIISITWRPDGRVLAIGAYNDKTKDHICSLHDVENGKKIFSITKKSAITSVSWFKYSANTDEKDEYDDLVSSRLRLAPTKKEESPNFSHQLAHGQTDLTILMISTDNGKISFYALGLFYLGDISIHSDANSETIKTHMSTCLRYLTSLIYTKHSNYFTSTLRVVKINTFHDRSQEILRIARMYAKITDELEFLDDTIKAMAASWADVLAGLDNKLSSYSSRRNQRADDSQQVYTLISADELLQLLVIGFPSDNLEKFLADMSDKGLRRLNSAIEQTCLRVQNLVIKNAQKCCYHLHNDLNMLRGMSLWKERFKDVGLNDKPIVDAMKSVGAFILKLSEMNQVIDHSLKSTKSFFRWLISINCRTSGEQNTSVQNETNKMTQQDIQLITDFILDNFDYNSPGSFGFSDSLNQSAGVDANRPTCSNFTLEQVGQYLKNEPLTRLKYSFSKPGSNFWIDFYRSKTELVEKGCLDEDDSSILLLYPHNPETSLIQEHRKTCDSIEGAFKSFASNIKLISQDDDSIIYIKEFIRNAPTESIRIETDLRLGRHYTLFQTKPKPVTKQYLISQSLADKSFRLLSIEFQTKQDSHSHGHTPGRIATRTSIPNTLLIADSCFFEDRETKKILLTFLVVDEPQNSTIFVQIQLDKIFESYESIERQSKDIARVFRNSESIDKLSVPAVIRIDLFTKPACNRKHDHDGMVVKKIKGTIGQNMFASSERAVIAFTSSKNERIHIYELESSINGPEIIEDESDRDDDDTNESLIDPDLVV